MTDNVWEGWWAVRWGRRMTHIEADDAEDAVQGSIDELRGMGDWTDDPSQLTAIAYTEYRGEPGDFTRAVVERAGRQRGRHHRGGGNRRRRAW